MKRFAFVVLLFSITCSIWAQTEENLFEWKTNQAVAKEKFINLHATQSSNNWPTFIKGLMSRQAVQTNIM